MSSPASAEDRDGAGEAPRDTSSLGSKVIKGVVWMTAARMVVRLLGFISTLILARLLVPADFGVVALAMSVVAMLELMTSFSLDVGLIHKAEINRDHLDTVWTLILVFNGLLALGLLALATPAAAFYREPRLHDVLVVLCLNQVITGLANIGVVYFRRQLDFRKEFTLQVSAKITGFIVTIPLAYFTRNYWALIVGILASTLATTVASYVMHPYRPRASLVAWREFLGFSSWLLVNNFFTFLRNRSSDLIIGRMLGAQSVGLFAMSFEIASLPATEGVAPINRVVFPAYVKVASDPPALERAFLRVQEMIALVLLPVTLGIAAVADLAVPVLLGEKWLDAVPIVQSLAAFSALLCLQTNTGSLCNALGKPRVISQVGLISLSTLVPLLILTARTGSLELVAAAFAAHSAVIAFPTTYILVARNTPVRLMDVWRAMWRPLFACVVMFVAVRYALQEFGWLKALHPMPALAIASLIGGAVYSAAIGLLWVLSGRPDSAEPRLLKGIRSPLSALI